MERKIYHFIGLFLIINTFTNVNAQDSETTINELNTILKHSLYQSKLEIDNLDIINRADNNGNSFIYSLNHIESISYDFDGFHNVILKLIKGEKAKTIIEGKKVLQP
jgi:uncharacterized protein YajQ (UPF0234 family)